jgi:hypothetical protein
MSSILSAYLSLCSRAEAAQVDADAIVATNKVFQEARVKYPLLLRMRCQLNM